MIKLVVLVDGIKMEEGVMDLSQAKEFVENRIEESEEVKVVSCIDQGKNVTNELLKELGVMPKEEQKTTTEKAIDKIKDIINDDKDDIQEVNIKNDLNRDNPEYVPAAQDKEFNLSSTEKRLLLEKVHSQVGNGVYLKDVCAKYNDTVIKLVVMNQLVQLGQFDKEKDNLNSLSREELLDSVETLSKEIFIQKLYGGEIFGKTPQDYPVSDGQMKYYNKLITKWGWRKDFPTNFKKVPATSIEASIQLDAMSKWVSKQIEQIKEWSNGSVSPKQVKYFNFLCSRLSIKEKAPATKGEMSKRLKELQGLYEQYESKIPATPRQIETYVELMKKHCGWKQVTKKRKENMPQSRLEMAKALDELLEKYEPVTDTQLKKCSYLMIKQGAAYQTREEAENYLKTLTRKQFMKLYRGFVQEFISNKMLADYDNISPEDIPEGQRR